MPGFPVMYEAKVETRGRKQRPGGQIDATVYGEAVLDWTWLRPYEEIHAETIAANFGLKEANFRSRFNLTTSTSRHKPSVTAKSSRSKSSSALVMPSAPAMPPAPAMAPAPTVATAPAVAPAPAMPPAPAADMVFDTSLERDIFSYLTEAIATGPVADPTDAANAMDTTAAVDGAPGSTLKEDVPVETFDTFLEPIPANDDYLFAEGNAGITFGQSTALDFDFDVEFDLSGAGNSADPTTTIDFGDNGDLVPSGEDLTMSTTVVTASPGSFSPDNSSGGNLEAPTSRPKVAPHEDGSFNNTSSAIDPHLAGAPVTAPPEGLISFDNAALTIDPRLLEAPAGNNAVPATAGSTFGIPSSEAAEGAGRAWTPTGGAWPSNITPGQVASQLHHIDTAPAPPSSPSRQALAAFSDRGRAAASRGLSTFMGAPGYDFGSLSTTGMDGRPTHNQPNTDGMVFRGFDALDWVDL